MQKLQACTRPMTPLSALIDQGVGKEQHQRDHQPVDGQALHEGQRQQQHAPKVVCHLWLPADAINAAARGDALADTGADRREADGEAGAHSGERWDPDGALIRVAAVGMVSAAALRAAVGSAVATGGCTRWGEGTKALPITAIITAPASNTAPVSTMERGAAIPVAIAAWCRARECDAKAI
eukprot:CAMPEP_0204572554 /NCGR_PEP_ID=MMETSP0661-20131031/39525_1 /ASSEMBLY_ACC=CAM_ASM_000606 /TAXON_ID=109239 /ORGANISM="Alexandrium margalefi, Strain AMGDE01CS-322" /LENGTH=180 /DNA_ID=CAMNT_0051580917 /DNA_START=69 /DNA_END=613 /DNA_ORIENTATION=-